MKYRTPLVSYVFVVAMQVVAAEPSTPVASPAPLIPPILAPLEYQPRVAHLAADVLTRYDYKTTSLDEAMSEKIFDRYLSALDPAKLYFTQADVDWFANVRSTLGEAIGYEDLHVPFDIFNVYERRFNERFSFARALLKQHFDFEKDESYQTNRDKVPWPDSDEELHSLWRERVKNDWLRLKLAGEKDDVIEATLDRRYGNFLQRASKTASEDVFQVFMDSYTTSIEPHTGYLGLKAAQELEIEMSLSLVGIGAILEQRDEFLVVTELLPGGPAALSGKLNIGDRLVGLGQGRTGPMVDVVGWRVEDAAELARGAKGSLVRLDVLPANARREGRHIHITLARNKIDFAEDAARKSVMQIKEGSITRSVGVITLPSFYQDVEARNRGEANFKSAARDVAHLLDELKSGKVDAVLVDLRNNGGGSLDEAIHLTGLFVGNGPVVQERDAQGAVNVESAGELKPSWNGPLAVLINRGSASASEIFASAIQDYGRGVIIGEPSFGKGTVQTIVNLDEIAHNDKPEFGELKLTIAQFFRVNGGTTQLRGVTPDVAFPSAFDIDRFGESSFDNALPWMQIPAAQYTPVGDLNSLLPLLQQRHASRIAKDKDFQYLMEDIADLKSAGDKHTVSLNEAERRKERAAQDARFKLRVSSDGGKDSASGEAASAYMSDRQDNGLAADDDLQDELAAEKAQKEAKDVRLNEAAHILSDQADLQQASNQMTTRLNP